MEQINKRKIKALLKRLSHDEKMLVLEALFSTGYYHAYITKRKNETIGVVDFYSYLSITGDRIELLNSIANKAQSLKASYIINCAYGYCKDKVLLVNPSYEDVIRRLLFELKVDYETNI